MSQRSKTARMSTGGKRSERSAIELSGDDDGECVHSQQLAVLQQENIRLRSSLLELEAKVANASCAAMILERNMSDLYEKHVKPANFVCSCVCEGEIPEAERKQPRFQFSDCNHYLCFECVGQFVNTLNADIIKCPQCRKPNASLKLMSNDRFRSTCYRLPASIKKPPPRFDLTTVMQNIDDEFGHKFLAEPTMAPPSSNV